MTRYGHAMPPAGLARGAAFLGLWIVLAGVEPVGLVVGLATAAAATLASLHLLPPTGRRLRLAALAGLAARLAWQSVVAGIDVARRAFDPKLPLRPGHVRYPMRLPEGSGRQAFAAMSCLVPGTVPVDTDAEGVLLVHCLDARPEVVTQLAADENRLSRALGLQAGHG